MGSSNFIASFPLSVISDTFLYPQNTISPQNLLKLNQLKKSMKHKVHKEEKRYSRLGLPDYGMGYVREKEYHYSQAMPSLK